MHPVLCYEVRFINVVCFHYIYDMTLFSCTGLLDVRCLRIRKFVNPKCGIVMSDNRKTLACVAAVLALTFVTACGAGNGNAGNEGHADASAEAAPRLVTVTSGTLVPTLSGDGTVHAGVVFAVTAPVAGAFEPSVGSGDMVAARQELGKIGDTVIIVPVEGRVASLTDAGANVPRNYPIATISYTGFSLELDASRLLRMIGSSDALSGRFQITDGQGPTECAAVMPVRAAPANNDRPVSDAGSADGSARLTCLIAKDVNVREGESGTVVLTATALQHSLLLPVSAVAGRSGTGTVTRVSGDKREQVKVSLGASDGARIVITSGLDEGDQVLAEAPNLTDKRTP